MDTTMRTLAEFVKNNKNSDPTHSQLALNRLEREASQYLVTAMSKKGFVASFCRQKANEILRMIEWASK